MKRITTFSIASVFIALAAGCGPAPVSGPAPGSLDAGFGNGGMVVSAMGSSTANGKGIAVQSDGKIIVAGTDDGDIVVFRYESDGSLDATFGVAGKASASFGLDEATCVALHDGKIVVAGYTGNVSSIEIFLVRFTSSGALDTSFNGDGKVTTSFGSGNDKAYGIAIGVDGRIVVAGSTGIHPDNVFAIACYTDAGYLDTSFSDDGKATAHFDYGTDEAFSVAIQEDGKIIAAGSGWGPGSNNFAIARFTATGDLDTTFSADGKTLTNVGTSNDLIFSIAIQEDGGIIAAGQGGFNEESEIIVARYAANGSLDTSFAVDGLAIYDMEPGGIGTSVKIQEDGKIVVAGYIDEGSGADFALLRHLPNGTLDASFGTGGIVMTDINSYTNIGKAIAIQDDGKILLLGDNSYLLAFYAPSILRYNP